MGLNFGGSSQKSNATTTQQQQYTPEQSDLQSGLLNAFKTLLPGLTSGGIGPNVAKVQTQNADTINKQSTGMGAKLQQFLASRGFGQSGESGKAQLQTELGRQGALAGNDAAAGQMQLNQNSSLLSDALAAAYKSIGYTGNNTTSGSGTNWGVSGSASFGF